MKKTKKKKLPSISTLKNKLDDLFSRYIRFRDVGSIDGYCACVSCGKMFHYRELDCGHFIPRGTLSIRWDEQNAHAQCHHCNRFREDAYIDYTLWMMDTYGEEVVERLRAEKHKTTYFRRNEYEIMIDYYAGKLAKLASGITKYSDVTPSELAQEEF